jgi:L-threonylcarbamoyladenylate synthase
MVRIDSHDTKGLEEIVGILRQGGVVCIPTDTAYGLAVNPHHAEAVRRLFDLKGRGADDPILLLVDSVEMTGTVGVRSPQFESVAGKFWPGPITIVIRAQPSLSERITAGTGTVGIRWPATSFPLDLLQALGGPVTATSANRSGQPIAATVDEAVEQLGDRLDAVVDGGLLNPSGTSTVLDLTSDPPVVLREGPVRFGALAEFLGGRLVKRPA